MRHRGEVLAGTRRRERGCADGGQDGTSKGREDGVSKCLGGGESEQREGNLPVGCLAVASGREAFSTSQRGGPPAGD